MSKLDEGKTHKIHLA